MKQLAESIENMKPGTKILISGVEYIRMDDHPSHYVYGCVLDPKTGLWGHWSRLVMFNEEIEVKDVI